MNPAVGQQGLAVQCDARAWYHKKHRHLAEVLVRRPDHGAVEYRRKGIHHLLDLDLSTLAAVQARNRLRKPVSVTYRTGLGYAETEIGNGDQRRAPQSHRSRGEIPEFASQRLRRASLTRGNVGGSHTRGKSIERFASARFAADWAINPSFHIGGGAGAKSTPQTGLRHISNRSRACRNGN